MKLRLPRLQFSLRTLVIGMVIVAAIASWHGSRYARYRARETAMIQGEEKGLRFFTREIANSDYGNVFLDDPQPSLAERWDAYWFGGIGGKQFPYVQMSMSRYANNQKTYDPSIYREILRHFPEAEIIDVRLHNTNSFEGVAWKMDGYPCKDSSGLDKAICDFTSIPKLRRIYASDPALISDDWVSALPEQSTLTHVKCPICLSPEGTLILLRKAPNLQEFWLNFTAKNELVEKALKDKLSIDIEGHHQYILRAKQ